jgi:hypothetical protein
MNKRILGEVIYIKPDYKDCNILYVTTEQYQGSDGKFRHNPSFWIEHKGVLYYAICKYDMVFLETFDDWVIAVKNFEQDYFNQFKPGEPEFHHLMKMKPIFYEVEFDRIEKFRDEFSEWEMDLIKPYAKIKERNNKLDDIL